MKHKYIIILFYFLLIQMKMIAQSNEAMIQQQNETAFNLFKQVQEVGKNLLIAPTSINAVLGIIGYGADNISRCQINNYLAIETSCDEGIFKHLYYNPARSTNNGYKSMNLVFYDSAYVSNEYINMLRDSIKVETYNLNNAIDKEINDFANNWIQKATKGLISSLPVQIKNNETFVGLNASYFCGEWQYEFDKDKTRKNKFKSSIGNKEMMFLNTKRSFSYYGDKMFQMVSLPYKDGYYMLILMPDSNISIEALLNELTYKDILSAVKKSLLKPLHLSLPKFNYGNTLSLKHILGTQMNIFSPQATLSGISSKIEFHLSDIIHQTIIKVDEHKTEAAALTEAILVGYSGRKTIKYIRFNVNRPFFFMIVDKENNIIRFMGKYNGSK